MLAVAAAAGVAPLILAALAWAGGGVSVVVDEFACAVRDWFEVRRVDPIIRRNRLLKVEDIGGHVERPGRPPLGSSDRNEEECQGWKCRTGKRVAVSSTGRGGLKW